MRIVELRTAVTEALQALQTAVALVAVQVAEALQEALQAAEALQVTL